MKQEGLNQKEFSALTGISPATLSSIFNGRTSPTLNHAEALHRCFPKLSMPWLMFGEGEMFAQPSAGGQPGGQSREHSVAPMLFPDEMAGDAYAAGGAVPGEVDVVTESGRSTAVGDGGGFPVVREVVKYIDKPKRKVTEVRIFFDDGTFETFPGK